VEETPRLDRPDFGQAGQRHVGVAAAEITMRFLLKFAMDFSGMPKLLASRVPAAPNSWRK
jgi:hypothetical protein